MERKLKKACDIVQILTSVQRSNIVSSALLTQQQKILAKFQRKRLIEHTDITDSSDQLSDFYENKEQGKLKPVIQSSLSQLAKKDHLDRIDRILLKGVYSNNKKELENPRLLEENQIRHHIYEGIKEFLHQNTGRFESEVNVQMSLPDNPQLLKTMKEPNNAQTPQIEA